MQGLAMSKKDDVVRPIASSREFEINYNLESKKQKLKAMKVSPLIMKMWEKE